MSEACHGCGIVVRGLHPVVGVMKDEATDRMIDVPVCEACWKDPEHRTKNALKAHFYMKADAATGLAASQRMLELSKLGKHLGVGGNS